MPRGHGLTMTGVDGDAIARSIETIYRMERVRLIAGLVRRVRDIALAEDLAHEALVAALSTWPQTGIPANPGGWLMTTAKRRAIDLWRRRKAMAAREDALSHEGDTARIETEALMMSALDDEIGDETLSLIFIACHPLLSRDQRVALTLRVIGGLSTDEIARAFLVPEPTMAQRIVRAKRTLGEAALAFEVPRGTEREQRLASVLEVLYLIFNEGHVASRGEDLIRPRLCNEAMRLGRILAALAPDEPEVHGLLALMELQASRLSARLGDDGMPITLERQDRGLWDRLLIGRGLAGIARAAALGGEDGIYALQAALAACHATAPTFDATDWTRIAHLYDKLIAALPSPVVALNRAVAHSMAFGPQVGLDLTAGLDTEPALARYAALPAARGDFLQRLGRLQEAQDAFRRAAALSTHGAERRFLQGRAACCEASLSTSGAEDRPIRP